MQYFSLLSQVIVKSYSENVIQILMFFKQINDFLCIILLYQPHVWILLQMESLPFLTLEYCFLLFCPNIIYSLVVFLSPNTFLRLLYVCIHWRFLNWVVSVYTDWTTQSLKVSSGLLLNNKAIKNILTSKDTFCLSCVFIFHSNVFNWSNNVFFFIKYL